MSRYLKTAVMFFLVLALWSAKGWAENSLTQVSTIDALLAGAYDGQATIGQLKTFGDLGIGTFHALDGEMIAINGKFFQAKSDGLIYIAPDSLTSPFAVMTFFEAEQTAQLATGLNFEAFAAMVDGLLPSVNLFYAFKVEGTFEKVRMRMIPAQTKPYPPLTEAVKHQSQETLENVQGTMIGFRCPPFVKGVNMPGYHLHFISKDEKSGGHVQDFTVVQAVMQWDAISDFCMKLPRDSSFYQMNLDKDRQEDLKKVEK